MSNNLEAVLIDHIQSAIGYFDKEGLLLWTNAAWERTCGINGCSVVLTYDDFLENTGVRPLEATETIRVDQVIHDMRSFVIRRRKVTMGNDEGLMVEIENISSIVEKDKHVSQIFSDAMWKIRSRISSVENVLALLGEYKGCVLEDDVFSLVTRTRLEVWMMMRQTENLRYLSYLDFGSVKIEPVRSKVPVNELIEDVCADCEPLFNVAEAGVDVQCAVNDDEMLFTDKIIVKKILSTLIFNAVQYNNGPVKILVSVKKVDAALILSVTDNGVGIPEKEQSMIFSYGFRGAESLKRAYSGTGVELYIARKLMMVLGGGIDMISKETVGSTFTLSFRDLDNDQK